jgi:transketolase
VRLVEGHDMNAIRNQLSFRQSKPLCLILDTVKGKGVSFMEHPSWHCKVPTDEEYKIAMKELGV